MSGIFSIISNLFPFVLSASKDSERVFQPPANEKNIHEAEPMPSHNTTSTLVMWIIRSPSDIAVLVLIEAIRTSEPTELAG
jgi:hypothetical protein